MVIPTITDVAGMPIRSHTKDTEYHGTFFVRVEGVKFIGQKVQ
tara:strand:- start:90 stop:218 length:129 start_codon:yes stop_codon:yes gene_type:complete